MRTILKIDQPAGRRGSVMIVTLVLSLLLASVVMYSMSDSMTAKTVNEGERNYSSALAAAEYGAELAIAEVGRGLKLQPDANGLVDDYSVVIGDWVLGSNNGQNTLFETSGGRALDQRRIAGVFNDHDFRVRVRAVRLAYDNNYVGSGSGYVLPNGWVSYPGAFAYGKDKAYDFSEVYEITSTARNRNATAPGVGGRLAATPVVQALVSLKYESFAKNMQDNGAVLHLEDAGNFAVTGGMTSVPDNDAPLVFGQSPNDDTATLQPQTLKNVYNITISGEDHAVKKQHVEKVQSEKITTPLKLTTNDTNFFGAYGGYWTAGQLTLNYRMEPESTDANPHRPKTPTFGTGENQKMWVANKNAEYDTYLLGGKQSRTVRLNEDVWYDGVMGQIIETSSGQALEGGKFNIVLGQFEDLRNLYINMAGVVGAYTDPTNWWQIYVGQYTHSRRSANTTITRSLPNYTGTKIRAQTIHLMKNEKEQFLVRLYEKSGLLYKYPISGGKWTGKYVWADATFNGNGLTLNKTVTPTATKPGEASGQYTVGRSFFWQELVGYQLVRRGERTNPAPGITVTTDLNEPAVIDQRDLPASGQKIDKRTIYRLDASNNRIPAGFDEIYQGYDQREYSTTVTKHPLADSKYGGQTSPGYLQDRFDPIIVRLDDGTEKSFTNMDAFLFPKNFGDADEPNWRDSLALFIGYEDQRETTADYNYTDMMFTIWISPQQEEVVVDRLALASSSLQWWERDERDGLTGDTSHMAISVNQTVDAETLPEGKTLEQAHYELFNTTLDPSESGAESLGYNIWTMRDDAQVITDFPRARFVYESGKFNTGKLDINDKVVAKYLMEHQTTFYVSRGDLNDYLRYLLKDEDLVTSDQPIRTWYDVDTGQWDYALVLASLQNDVPENAGFTFIDVDARWDIAGKNRDSLEDDASESLMISSEALKARELAGAIIGYHRQKVPVIDTKDFEAEENAQPESLTLGFLPGELDLTTNPLDWMTLGLPATGDALQVRQDPITFMEPDETGTLRVDYVKGYFDVDPAKAVAMCYVDYNKNDQDTAEYLAKEYGLKEKRYSIGYHRAGTDKSLREFKSQDHYEIVALGQTGFNPYRTTVSGDTYIADELGEDETRRSVRFNYTANGGVAPDFVFENAIDGAGAMVINGNLVVKDTFAYYGTLVVLGDVTIIPTKKSEYVYNSDGRPVDEYGHALYLEKKTNPGDPDVWYYIWEYIDPETNVKKGGDPIADKTYVQLQEAEKLPRLQNGDTIKVVPFMQSVYRGELVVQGNIVVKGKIRTEVVTDERGVDHYGQFTALWSSEAVNTMGKSWSQGGEMVGRLSWIHNDNIDVESIWNNTLDR